MGGEIRKDPSCVPVFSTKPAPVIVGGGEDWIKQTPKFPSHQLHGRSQACPKLCPPVKQCQRVGEKTAPPLPPRALPEPPQVHSPHGNRKPKGERCSVHQPQARCAKRQGGACLGRLWLGGPTHMPTPTDVFSYRQKSCSPSFGEE